MRPVAGVGCIFVGMTCEGTRHPKDLCCMKAMGVLGGSENAATRSGGDKTLSRLIVLSSLFFLLYQMTVTPGSSGSKEHIGFMLFRD